MNESNITNLPDGSAFFTADIMSKEEAMHLPLKERPICFRISSEMYADCPKCAKKDAALKLCLIDEGIDWKTLKQVREALK